MSEIQDLKIRFGSKDAESWLTFWIFHINDINWEEMKIGMINFEVISVKNKPRNQISYYRTKTQRVVFISANEPFK
jgi:hypothetical protein